VPGAKVPFGFANPSPDTVPNPDPNSWATNGYESDKPIIGFSQTHVSGTGGESKYGNFRVTPQAGEVNLKDLASQKRNELAEPGYYAVTLAKPDVWVELTATRLVAVHRYTFRAASSAHLLIDAGSVVFTGGARAAGSALLPATPASSRPTASRAQAASSAAGTLPLHALLLGRVLPALRGSRRVARRRTARGPRLGRR